MQRCCTLKAKNIEACKTLGLFTSLEDLVVHQLFFQNDGTANGVVFVGRLSPVNLVTSLSLSRFTGVTAG
jgi:hypothetical protein